MSVIASVRLVAVDGRRLTFDVSAVDERDTIARGVHERVVVERERFWKRAAAKAPPTSP